MPVDGYDLNIIAPDHLLTGLTKGVLTVVFLQLANETERIKVQISLKASLAEYGYQTQTVLFKKNKLVSGLSMSVLYCLLTLLPTTLQSLGLLQALPCKKLLLNLNWFYTMAFWWPNLNSDGHEAWKFIHGCRMTKYHGTLQKLARNFVKSVNRFCSKYPELGSHVDKPNTHRLLELSIHTIPRFNHISYVCELVFESAHQPLKFYLSRNNTLNSHVHSVQLILAKDWLQRVWALWTLHRDDSETDYYRDLA